MAKGLRRRSVVPGDHGAGWEVSRLIDNRFGAGKISMGFSRRAGLQDNAKQGLRVGKKMNYRVVLVESEEGFSVSFPMLKGCHSQGRTREEALENIRDAIREWLGAEDAEKAIFSITEEEVVV